MRNQENEKKWRKLALRHVDVDVAVSGLQQRVGGVEKLSALGVGQVIPRAVDNALVVEATSTGVQMLQAHLRLVDVAPTALSRESIKLQHVAPSTLLGVVMDGNYNPRKPGAQPNLVNGQNLVPPGISTLIPDDAGKTLQVVGAPQAIAEIRTLVRLLDVAPKQVMVRATLLHRSFEAKTVMELVTFDLAMVNNGTEGRVFLLEGKRYSMQVTAHINGNGTITVQVEAQTASGREVVAAKHNVSGIRSGAVGYVYLESALHPEEMKEYLHKLKSDPNARKKLIPGVVLEVKPVVQQ